MTLRLANEQVWEVIEKELFAVIGKDFITYGIGIPLLRMRDPVQARGRAPVTIQEELVKKA